MGIRSAVCVAASAALVACSGSSHSTPPPIDPGPPCAPRTLTVEWSGFTGGDGYARGCVAAGVASVDVYLDGAYVSTWPCTDGGAVITGVASGAHSLDVEGLESSGRIAYRDELPATVGSCGDSLYQAAPAEGFVDVNYAFPYGGSCVGTLATPSYMWFSVFDQVAGAVAAEVSERTLPVADQKLYWCGVYANDPDPAVAAHALFFPLPAGTYRMRWIEERQPTSTVVGAACTPFDFTVAGGTTTTIPGASTPVTLANTSTACAHP
jgi:hypothetical protein